MRTRLTLTVFLCLSWAAAPAFAQPDPPSIEPGDLPSGFVADRFYGSEVRLENTTPTANIVLEPFAPREFFQAPELTDPRPASASLEDRLFRHDYLFTVSTEAFGNSTIDDINLMVANSLLVDILQLTFGLFENSVDPANLIAGLEVDPPDAAGATISFTDLEPGTQYILRVAGVLNGYGLIPEGDVFAWHGQYQGNIAVAPIPGAVALFATALAGLGLLGWRQSRA